jgi:hypothetical protein
LKVNLWKWTFDDEPLIWTFDLTPLIWWTLIWTLAMMNPLLLWTLWYGPWFELWLWTLPSVTLWPEPLLCTWIMNLWFWYFGLTLTLPFVLPLTLQYYTRVFCFLAMKVTWLWHWCTNVMTPVWSSDVPHRPFVWSAFGLGRGVWMHPRFALIWFATTFGLVSGTVCNTCLSHIFWS